jgi:hypothetical protein
MEAVGQAATEVHIQEVLAESLLAEQLAVLLLIVLEVVAQTAQAVVQVIHRLLD